jgi:hypothetical protein
VETDAISQERLATIDVNQLVTLKLNALKYPVMLRSEYIVNVEIDM